LTLQFHFERLIGVDSKACEKIPYAAEQGIFLEEQGNEMGEQGNWEIVSVQRRISRRQTAFG
jgi:hypothetical protein